MSNLKYQMGGYTPTNLQQAAFIPTYAGTPLEDAQKYGTDLLNTYKSNIADLTKLDIANAQRRVIEGDTAESAKYDQQLKAQFEEMAKKGDYESMSAQVNELARRHVNDKGLKVMAESRAIADKEDELIMKMRAAGQEPLFLQDRTKYKSVSYDEKGNPVYNVYKATAETPLDYQAKKADIWNVIKPSLAGLSEKQVNETMRAIDGYITTGTWKGISNTTITKKVEDALTAYKGSSEYRQERRVDMLKAQEMGLEGKAADDWVESEQRRKMKSEGMLRVFSESHPDYVKDWILADSMAAAGKPDTNGRGVNVIPGVRTPVVPLTSVIDKFEAPDKTSSSTRLTSNYAGVNQSTAQLEQQQQANLPIYERGTKEDRDEYERIAREYVKTYMPVGTLDKFYNYNKTDMFGRQLPNTVSDIKDAEKAEKEFLYGEELRTKLKNITKSLEDTMRFAPVYDFASNAEGTKAAADANSKLKRDFAIMKFYDPTTGKVLSPIDNPEFFNAYDDEKSEMHIFGETMGLHSTGVVAKDPSFHNAWVGSYKTKDDPNPKVFYAAKGPYERQLTNPRSASNWTTVISKPYSREKVQEDGIGSLTVESRPDDAGNNVFVLHEVNGKPLPESENTFEDYAIMLKFIKEAKNANRI